MRRTRMNRLQSSLHSRDLEFMELSSSESLLGRFGSLEKIRGPNTDPKAMGHFL